jgi:hypothetical protein
MRGRVSPLSRSRVPVRRSMAMGTRLWGERADSSSHSWCFRSDMRSGGKSAQGDWDANPLGRTTELRIRGLLAPARGASRYWKDRSGNGEALPPPRQRDPRHADEAERQRTRLGNASRRSRLDSQAVKECGRDGGVAVRILVQKIQRETTARLRQRCGQVVASEEIRRVGRGRVALDPEQPRRDERQPLEREAFRSYDISTASNTKYRDDRRVINLTLLRRSPSRRPQRHTPRRRYVRSTAPTV